jgi:hypothetical protein
MKSKATELQTMNKRNKTHFATWQEYNHSCVWLQHYYSNKTQHLLLFFDW